MRLRKAGENLGHQQRGELVVRERLVLRKHLPAGQWSRLAKRLQVHHRLGNLRPEGVDNVVQLLQGISLECQHTSAR